VFHTHDFSDFLRKLAPPCAAPAGGRCIDDQGRPITPIPGRCYIGSFCHGRPSPGLCWDLPVSTVKGWLGASSTDALVANITPNLNTAQLAEIVGIWGYYYPCWTSKVGPWTVIMLKLNMLWVDTIPGSGWIRPTTVPSCNPRIAIKMWDRFPVPPKPGRSTFLLRHLQWRDLEDARPRTLQCPHPLPRRPGLLLPHHLPGTEEEPVRLWRGFEPLQVRLQR